MVGGASAISSDGNSGFFATATGIVHIRLSDGATVEAFNLGRKPARMWLSPDRLTLLATSSTKAFAIDLC
jgi:hypothetical protein